MLLTKKTALLGLFVLLKFALQIVLIGPGYELHRDEFLHIDQGKHLAWGYLSLPPATSWISWIIIHLGNSVFWVKFFPALFGVLTIVVIWKTIEELNGGLFALIMGATAITFSALLRMNILFQPNSLEILIWSVLYFVIVKYINSDENKWLWAIAVTCAIGFLNKYNIAFVMIGLVPGLLLTEHRRIFLNRTFYLALSVALVLILPNLVWQYQHDFPVFYHMQLLSKYQLVNVERTGFLREQLLFFIGSIFILVLAFISFFRYQPFKKYRVFFWSFAFTISMYVYFRAKGYYAIGLYPIFIAFGSVYLEQLLAKGWLRNLRAVAILLPILLFIRILHIAFPIDNPEVIKQNGERFRRFGLLRWEDGKDHELPQDFADMQGWKELAMKVDQVYDSFPDKNSILVLCDNYGQAGAINFYSRNKSMQAVSKNADYIDWFPLEHEIRNVILVTEMNDDDLGRVEERPLFKTVYFAGEIENPYAREHGTHVFVLKDARMPVNERLRNEIREVKMERQNQESAISN